MSKRRSSLLFSLALVMLPCTSFATLIPVKYKEGTTHGFLVLRSQDGKVLAAGDFIETVEGERVTAETALRFRDGSLYDEVAVFSQNSDFRLISDHLRQQGPSFPKPIDVNIDVASGIVEISSGDNSKQKSDQQHLQMPEDVANGLFFVLLKNLSQSDPETIVSMVSPTSKARVVKLRIHSEGEQRFSAGGARLKATHYVVHTDIGGVAGAVATAAGKKPPDLHFWLVGGKAPVVIRFTGELFEGGPIWTIELASVRLQNNTAPAKSR